VSSGSKRFDTATVHHFSIEPIDRAAIRARNQMQLRVDRDLDAAMPGLFLHVSDALALL
jgi:hypothetical protein